MSLEWEDDAQELLDNVAYDQFELEYSELSFDQQMFVMQKVGELLDLDSSQKSHGL